MVMRRLNLLRQLLYVDAIGSILDLKPHTRYMSAVLNIEFSRRRWCETLHTSRRDFLRLCGYPLSRHNANRFEDFLIEGVEAGLFNVTTTHTGTIFTLEELTKAHLSRATALALERHKSPNGVPTIPPPILPRTLPKDSIKEQANAPISRGNKGNERNKYKGGDSDEKPRDVGHGDPSVNSLSRELAELGL